MIIIIEMSRNKRGKNNTRTNQAKTRNKARLGKFREKGTMGTKGKMHKFIANKEGSKTCICRSPISMVWNLIKRTASHRIIFCSSSLFSVTFCEFVQFNNEKIAIESPNESNWKKCWNNLIHFFFVRSCLVKGNAHCVAQSESCRLQTRNLIGKMRRKKFVKQPFSWW